MTALRVEISKIYPFEAAHHLEGLPSGHKCAGIHGHSYTVEVCLSSLALDSVGFVVDYAKLDEIVKLFISYPGGLDHSDLNEKLEFNPTSERLAIWYLMGLAPWIAKLNDVSDDPETWIRIAWVEVKETEKTSARVYPA